MSLLLAGYLVAAASSPAVVAEYGGYKYNNLAARWHRYDFELSNMTAQPQELSVCAADVELSIRDHRVESEKAFAVQFADDAWSHDCSSRIIAPGESVRLATYFDEWWANESTSPRRMRIVEARTSTGTYTMQFTPSRERGKRVVQVSSRAAE